MKKRLILYVLLATLLYPAHAQTSRLYTSELGLPNSQINRICQDGQDFLWVCTEGGLLRFDGVTFEEFRHDRNNDFSLLSDFNRRAVREICLRIVAGAQMGRENFNSEFCAELLRDFNIHMRASESHRL